jgi:hypothetical protein
VASGLAEIPSATVAGEKAMRNDWIEEYKNRRDTPLPSTHGFKCNGCGQEEPVPTRIPIQAYTAWKKAFTYFHGFCKPEKKKSY